MDERKKPKRKIIRKKARVEASVIETERKWYRDVAAWIGMLIVGLIVSAYLIFVAYYGAGLALERKFGQPAPAEMEIERHERPTIKVKQEHYVGKCRAEVLLAEVAVYVIPPIEDSSIGGMFIPSINSIVLINKDLNTIAHEVSHYIDAVMEWKGIKDGETRAYLQGYFTECVHNMASSTKSV